MEDSHRQGRIEKLGIHFIRYTNEQVLSDIESILKELEQIIAELQQQ